MLQNTAEQATPKEARERFQKTFKFNQQMVPLLRSLCNQYSEVINKGMQFLHHDRMIFAGIAGNGEHPCREISKAFTNLDCYRAELIEMRNELLDEDGQAVREPLQRTS
jgi:hypothetical protein